MTTLFCGAGGNNSNNGTSWALRKANAAGIIAIEAAGDVVYFGPGGYGGNITPTAAGSSGSPITWIADVTGEHTDGIGGRVRISGTTNETSSSIANGIVINNGINYRTFRGFSFDAFTGATILVNASASNMIVEDCVFAIGTGGAAFIQINGTSGNHIIRRCEFLYNATPGVQFVHTSTVNDLNNLVENCVFKGGGASINVRVDRVGGVTVKNCSFLSGANAVRVTNALASGQVCTVNNCLLVGQNTALSATTTAEFVEDYNILYGNSSDRSNVNTGTHSVSYPPNFRVPLLLSGFMFPRFPEGWLANSSALVAKAGTSESSDDLFGMTRPTTSSKKSWGAIQSGVVTRDTSTVQAGSASLKLADAGMLFLKRVPVTNVSTTISMYVNREANYAGTNPQMLIRQPGQSDITVTDAGSASAWNQLTNTFTPAANPPYVDIFLVSNNTATSGSYATYADAIAVS